MTWTERRERFRAILCGSPCVHRRFASRCLSAAPRARNVTVCLQGHAPFSAAVHAVYETLTAVRRGVPPRDLKNLASSKLLRQVTRADDYQQWTKDYLGGA